MGYNVTILYMNKLCNDQIRPMELILNPQINLEKIDIPMILILVI
jgi:hypothetical protein